MEVCSRAVRILGRVRKFLAERGLHLHEMQGFAFLRDDIQLTRLPGLVARDDAKSMALQLRARN